MSKLSNALYSDINSVDPISYRAIKNELYEWRVRGTNSSEFNDLDQPGHLFFKIVFHFWNGDAYNMADTEANHNGLLTPAWLLQDDKETKAASNEMGEVLAKQVDDQAKGGLTRSQSGGLARGYLQNCAYNFLLRNDELERAEKLKQFVELLSNISTYSPWYFMEIGGLDALLERPFKHDDAYLVEAPKQITIKCLQDSEDNRVATLLDLYRDVAYSYAWHREVLPANLRKFDMSIYIYSSPIATLHSQTGKYGATMKDTVESDSQWHASYKRIELHNCEIDYNSSKSGYGTLNNAEGFGQEFTITLNVDDAYETRYNTYMDRYIGDMIAIDMMQNTYNSNGLDKIFTDEPQTDTNGHFERLKKLLYPGGSIDVVQIADDLTGNVASNAVKSQLLGNIHKASISDMAMNANRMVQAIGNGNVGGVVKAADELTEVKNGWFTRTMGNINDANKVFNRTRNIEV